VHALQFSARPLAIAGEFGVFEQAVAMLESDCTEAVVTALNFFVKSIQQNDGLLSGSLLRLVFSLLGGNERVAKRAIRFLAAIVNSEIGSGLFFGQIAELGGLRVFFAPLAFSLKLWLFRLFAGAVAANPQALAAVSPVELAELAAEIAQTGEERDGRLLAFFEAVVCGVPPGSDFAREFTGALAADDFFEAQWALLAEEAEPEAADKHAVISRYIFQE
jgi:hypothetical protein